MLSSEHVRPCTWAASGMVTDTGVTGACQVSGGSRAWGCLARLRGWREDPESSVLLRAAEKDPMPAQG